MNNPLSLLFFVVVLTATLTCKKDGNDDCDSPISITLSPEANPTTYEILITGSGFTDEAVVRFGNVLATTRPGEALGGLIAKVPSGLAGPIEVTVEEDGCIGRADFTVLGAYPTDSPQSPVLIVIPQPPATLPTSFGNFWQNLDDANHGLNIQPKDFDSSATMLDASSSEFHFGGNTELNENPLTGTILLAPANEVSITIDRTAKGLGKEDYEGMFIAPATVGSPFNSILLLKSKKTGRQLVIGADL